MERLVTFDITQYYLSSVIDIWTVSVGDHWDLKFKSLLRLMPLTTPVSYIPYETLYSINLDLDLECRFPMMLTNTEKYVEKE